MFHNNFIGKQEVKIQLIVFSNYYLDCLNITHYLLRASIQTLVAMAAFQIGERAQGTQLALAIQFTFMDEGQNTSLPLIACSVCIFFLDSPSSFTQQTIHLQGTGFRLCGYQKTQSIQIPFFYSGVSAIILHLLITHLTLIWHAASMRQSGLDHNIIQNDILANLVFIRCFLKCTDFTGPLIYQAATYHF